MSTVKGVENIGTARPAFSPYFTSRPTLNHLPILVGVAVGGTSLGGKLAGGPGVVIMNILIPTPGTQRTTSDLPSGGFGKSGGRASGGITIGGVGKGSLAPPQMPGG